MNRMLRVALPLVAALALSACGFHLRRSAALPPSMSQVHLTVSGGGDLERGLTRALENANVTVEDDAGPGIAELRVPVASFGTQSLTQGGYVRITEYAVNYNVEFDVTGADGKVLLPHQRISMQREYSYDSTDTVGNASQVQQIQRSLVDDMVQAIMFRLEAAGRHAQETPAPAGTGGH
ncbi:LPS assembly lipoprotein LptE [Rhodanobacter aciditrophus]|uniref:LPS-assembly lipoprotein LptE n=1 Tax=Rhodanobacter aciditrophus TaxID=1623218 RepID=UPI003CEFFD8A